MNEEIKDVNVDETKVEETKVDSTEEKSKDESSSDSSTDKDKVIPYDRFSTVVKERNELREQLSKGEIAKKDEVKTLTPEEKKEIDAKTYLKNLYKEVMTEEESQRKQKEEQELKTFNSEVNSALELNLEVKREDFLKFIEEKSKSYGVKSITGAMALYKDLNKSVLEAKDQGKKEILNRPKTPVNEGQSSVKSDDTGKSFYQLAQEAKQLIK